MNNKEKSFWAGAYSGGERLGARPLWIFRILRDRALSLTTAIEKETKRKKVIGKKKKYIVSGVMMAKPPPPSSPQDISVYPLFSLFL